MTKRALLIGINRYKVPGADLRGCVNDVANVEDTLVRYCGFSPAKIKKITDLRATKQRMQSEIEKLVSRAKRGDVLLLHYSGHGSNVPDTNNRDEARDEILCPTDLDWYDPLLDDWLRDCFDSLVKGASLTVLLDCCHSGTATRELRPPDAKIVERYLPCPLDLMQAESGRSLRGRTRAKRKRRRGRARRRDVVHVNIPEVLISGCRDNQTSADAYINGDYNGAMTYNLMRAIRSKRGKLTNREAHALTLKYLKRHFAQVPQLEGRAENLDRPFLAAP